jgi:hypothetical protein
LVTYCIATRQYLPVFPRPSACISLFFHGYPPVSPCFWMAIRLYLTVFAWLSACISLFLHGYPPVSHCFCMAVRLYRPVFCMAIRLYSSVFAWLSACISVFPRLSACISLFLHSHPPGSTCFCMAIRMYPPVFAWLSACISLQYVQYSLCTEYAVRGKRSLFTCQHIIFLDLIIAEPGGREGGGSASGLLDAVFHNCMFWCTIYLKRELDEPYSAKPAQRSRLYRPDRLHWIDTVPA